MSAGSYYKAPPRKTEEITYENWKKEIIIWQFQSSLDDAKKGSALFLSLEGKARQTVLAEVDTSKINCTDGIKNILTALDKFYKKDSTKSAFAAFDDFIKYQRNPGMSLKDYLIDFNLKYHKMENADMTLPTGVLACMLLNCCNISNEKQEICRATCPELTYEKMKETIEKVGVGSTSSNCKQGDSLIKFSSQESMAPCSSKTPDLSGLNIKQEPTFVADVDCTYDEEVLYGYNNNHRNYNQRGRASSRRPVGNYGHRNFRKSYGNSTFNPPDSFGNTMTCNYCHSVCHLIQKCPDCPEHLKRRSSANGAYATFEYESQYL